MGGVGGGVVIDERDDMGIFSGQHTADLSPICRPSAPSSPVPPFPVR